MPYGLLIDTAAVILGALLGISFGGLLPEKLKENLTVIFGLICLALGITLVTGVNALVPVGIALILGTAAGEALRIEERIFSLLGRVQSLLSGKAGKSRDSHEVISGVITLIPLFCFSTTIILGGMNEALGNHDMLLVKSVLDFFTAVIFAANYGILVGLLSIPLFLTGMAFYLLAALLMPVMTPSVIADMNAAGGVHCIACAFGVIGIRKLQVNNMLPALLFALPASALWTVLSGI